MSATKGTGGEMRRGRPLWTGGQRIVEHDYYQKGENQASRRKQWGERREEECARRWVPQVQNLRGGSGLDTVRSGRRPHI